MNARNIDNLFNHYKNSISSIRNAESKLLKESYSYQKWVVSLREKSELIRSLYVKNEILYNQVVGELIKYPETLDEDTAKLLLSHIDFFICEGYNDAAMIEPILDLLIPYYTKHDPITSLFDCYYFMGIYVIHNNNYNLAIDYFNKAIAIFPDAYTCKEDYRRYRIMCSYYFRLMSYLFLQDFDDDTITEYIETALTIWEEDPTHTLTRKKKLGISYIIRSLACQYVYFSINAGNLPASHLTNLVEDEFAQKLMLNDMLDIDNRFYVTYFLCMYKQRKISKECYVSYILDKYQHDFAIINNNFTYSSKTFIALFDNEVSNVDFDIGSLFYMNDSFKYVFCLLTECLKYCDNNVSGEILSAINKYYSKLPFLSGEMFMDAVIEHNIKNLFVREIDKNHILKIINTILVSRQVFTTIHSTMVSKIAEVITSYYVDKAPELFVGICGANSVGDVISNKDKFIDYAITASRCHDIGKISCSDIVNLQFRKLVSSEFEVIKNHPRRGYDILCSIEALSPYKDVALGHHMNFDGTSGYPVDCDILNSPVRIFVDIIKLCDCIDTATDALGRNYAKPKNFYQVLNEFKAEKGAKYSDTLVDLLCESNELMNVIDDITQNKREYVYYDIYRNFIESETDFTMDDEVHIRRLTTNDFEKVIEFATDYYNSSGENSKFLSSCYGIVDGKDTILGIIMADIDVEHEMVISYIYVDEHHRHKSYASQLISHLERWCKSNGILTMKVHNTFANHNDKLFWRNGFTESFSKVYMIKKLNCTS